MIKNIAILGIGGVGGFFGGKMARLPSEEGVRVHFVARGEHLQAIQQDGLTLNTEKEGVLHCVPALATDQIDALPPLDLCVICVKGFDLHNLLLALKERITEQTILLPLLNGVDIYTRIRSVLPSGVVLPASVNVGTHIASPGVVTQKGGTCKILFGADPEHPDFSPEELMGLFHKAEISAELRSDIATCLWEKFIFIAPFGMVTAASNKSIGEVLEVKELRESVQQIMLEVASVAAAQGVALPEKIVETSLQMGGTFPHKTTTSFQRDFADPNKRDERDIFVAAVKRLAKESGIAVPCTAEWSEKLERIKPA